MKKNQLYTKFINILLSLLLICFTSNADALKLDQFIDQIMWFNEKSYGDDVQVFYNCLLHAFKPMIQGFMPIRAYTTMQEDVGVREILDI